MTTQPPTRLQAPVRYFDGITEVRLGDVITTRVWGLWKRTGRVVYVPGLSAPHGEFERDHLMWIGVKCPDGMLFGSLVDPATGCLRKKVHFNGRDASACEVVTPETRFPE